MSPNNATSEMQIESNTHQITTIQANHLNSPQPSKVTLPSNLTQTQPTTNNTRETQGIPLTPERHVFSQPNSELPNNRYDSEGEQAPWVNNNNNEIEEVELNEQPLPLQNDHIQQQDLPEPNPNPTDPPVLTRERERVMHLSRSHALALSRSHSP